jgi:selenocysteine-specific elongation factor
VHVIATAGHVDHGKSTLVRALTGMEPDRWAEERRRGMTIDLGFAWTALPSGRQVAFVDVPGHERFIGNMLAGVGTVPAALVVVAADEGWMPQSAEHLAALDALGVGHGLLVITRSDLADPALAHEEALLNLAGSSLADVASVCVSGTTGQGLDELRSALDRVLTGLPAADPAADVRLWVDRAFTIRGAGTVVTGTLGAGTLRVGDEVEISPSGVRVRVRALESMAQRVEEVEPVARVAVNLRGLPLESVRRGYALLAPGRWLAADLVDVRLHGLAAGDLPPSMQLHAGAAAVPVRVRPLGADTARLSSAVPLPLRVGERALLRDPGSRALAGVTVLDVRPPALRRRGAAAARGAELAAMDGRPDPAGELRRRGLVRAGELAAMGVPVTAEPVVGDWLVDPAHWVSLGVQLREVVTAYAAAHPLEPGLPLEAARQQLALPDVRLVLALVTAPLTVREGRVTSGDGALPVEVASALEELRADLAAAPFHAPEAGRLAELGFTPPRLAAAVRAGALLRVADGVYLLPGADMQAVRVLAGVEQPFTVSAAREALGTTRRVVVPLLEHLDRRRLTRRLDATFREVAAPPRR